MFVTQGEAFSGLSDCQKELFLTSILSQDKFLMSEIILFSFYKLDLYGAESFGVVNWKKLET